MGLTNKRHEVTKRVSQTYFVDYFYLLLIYIIFFLYWYSFFNDAVKGFWRVQI